MQQAKASLQKALQKALQDDDDDDDDDEEEEEEEDDNHLVLPDAKKEFIIKEMKDTTSQALHYLTKPNSAGMLLSKASTTPINGTQTLQTSYSPSSNNDAKRPRLWLPYYARPVTLRTGSTQGQTLSILSGHPV